MEPHKNHLKTETFIYKLPLINDKLTKLLKVMIMNNYKPTEKANTSYMDALSTSLDMKGHPALSNVVNSVAHPKQTLSKLGEYLQKLDVNLGILAYQTLKGHPAKGYMEFTREHPVIGSSGLAPIVAACAMVPKIPGEDAMRAESKAKYPQAYELMASHLKDNGRDLVQYKQVQNPSADVSLPATYMIHKKKFTIRERIKAALVDRKETIPVSEQEVTNEFHE